jgi:hypothetical protein
MNELKMLYVKDERVSITSDKNFKQRTRAFKIFDFNSPCIGWKDSVKHIEKSLVPLKQLFIVWSKILKCFFSMNLLKITLILCGKNYFLIDFLASFIFFLKMFSLYL